MKLSRKMLAGFGLLLLFSLCAFGQNAPLTKDAVIQMVKAGLPDDVIISKIKSEPNLPNLSTDDLIALKTAGVSDGVIRALLSPPAAPAPAAVATIAPPADPNDPMAPHDPGVYLMTVSRAGVKTMVLIERAGSGRDKTAHVGQAALTMGIMKAQVRAEVPGPRASVRASIRPDFYMYFPPTGNLGSADAISSPTQFSLILLEKKKDHRETVVAKQGYGRASAGIDEKKTVDFTANKFRAYAYKVTPNGNLKAGEYAYIAATGMGGTASGAAVVIYDFGVDE
jgi:hypothetical protein